ncbi:Hypothetical protein, putative [Bodo saltans]|uniref:Uncharacterized protein n=1 Tax=Bodo saltans TaxID=75058 RepID=A0A0S4JRN0_BODSA|nr:Hypothetical protein, putative [Bodo saltans]|eukprot:CUG94198.1 Hypothetical protein, putative [Bodo saltans]
MFPMPLRNLFLCVRGQRLLGTPHTARCQPPHRVLPVKSPLALVRALDLEGRHGCPLLALRRPSVVSRSRWKSTNVKCRRLCLKSHTSFNVASSNTRMSSKRYLWPVPRGTCGPHPSTAPAAPAAAILHAAAAAACDLDPNRNVACPKRATFALRCHTQQQHVFEIPRATQLGAAASSAWWW